MFELDCERSRRYAGRLRLFSDAMETLSICLEVIFIIVELIQMLRPGTEKRFGGSTLMFVHVGASASKWLHEAQPTCH